LPQKSAKGAKNLMMNFAPFALFCGYLAWWSLGCGSAAPGPFRPKLRVWRFAAGRRCFRRAAVAAGAVFVSGFQLRAQEAATVAPTELPAFIVEESRDLPPPEAWRYASLPGVEVLSNASARETEVLLQEFEVFRRALAVVWPIGQHDAEPPVALILSARDGRFRDYLPAGGRGEESPVALRASVLLQQRGRTAIVLDLATKTTTLVTHDALQRAAGAEADGDTAPGGAADLLHTVDHQRQLRREYIRQLVSGEGTRIPAWFEEGMAQLFMSMRIERNQIVFAKVSESTIESRTRSTSNLTQGRPPPDFQAQNRNLERAIDRLHGQTEQDFNSALYYRRLMPWPEFFAVGRDSPEALNPIAGRWAKQAQALLHLGLYGNRRQYQKGFIALVRRLADEPMSEPLLRECVGLTYAKLSDVMNSYIQTTAHRYYTFKLVEGTLPKVAAIPLRDATEAEAGRINGTALSLAGNHTAARGVLRAAYVRGSREPALLGALGLAERAAGEDLRARNLLETAVAAGDIADPRVHLEIARLRFAAAAATVARDAPFAVEQVGGVLSPLFAARGRAPRLAEVYDLIADVWARSPVAPAKENLAVLAEGVEAFPGETALLLKAAMLYQINGFKEEAAELVRRGLAAAPDEATRQRLRAFE